MPLLLPRGVLIPRESTHDRCALRHNRAADQWPAELVQWRRLDASPHAPAGQKDAMPQRCSDRPSRFGGRLIPRPPTARLDDGQRQSQSPRKCPWHVLGTVIVIFAGDEKENNPK